MIRFIAVLLMLGKLIALLAFTNAAYAQDGTVTARLSSDSITRDDTVTLTITAVGLEGEPDVSALAQSFDIVGQSTSREIRTVTGTGQKLKTTSIVNWALELMPKGMGVFTVPAVTINGVSSQLLTLTVNDLPKGAGRDVFIEVSVDSQTPYVQSQVLMTLKVFHAIEIVDGGLEQPSADNLVVQRLGEDSVNQEERDGRPYRVFTRQLALFPQKSGPMAIPPVTLSVSVPADPRRARGFFAPTRKISRRSEAVTLEVQARPPGGAAWWLPAKAVQVEGRWSDDASAVRVDQPLTRTITVRASGVMDSQLPDIKLPAIDGVSLYAEQPERAMGINAAGLVASQSVNWALIPQRAGDLHLPAIEFEWFNTQSGKTEVAVLPAETITVLPALDASSAAEQSENGQAADGSPAANTPAALGSTAGQSAAGRSGDAQQNIPPVENAAGAGLSSGSSSGSSAGVNGGAAEAVEHRSDGSGDANTNGTNASTNSSTSAGSSAEEEGNSIAINSAGTTAVDSAGTNSANSPDVGSIAGQSSGSTSGALSSPNRGQQSPAGLPTGAGVAIENQDILSEQLIPLANRVRALEASVKNWRLAAIAAFSVFGFSIAALLWFGVRSKQQRRQFAAMQSGRGIGTTKHSYQAAAQGAKPGGSKVVSMAALESSCQSNEPLAVQKALLEWAAQQWPENPPQTLTALREQLPQGDAFSAIKALDAAMYSRRAAGDNQALSSILRGLPEALMETVKGQVSASPGVNGATASSASSASAASAGHRLPEL